MWYLIIQIRFHGCAIKKYVIENELGKIVNYLPMLKDSKILNDEFQVKFNKKESTGNNKRDSINSSLSKQKLLSTKNASLNSNNQSMRGSNIMEESDSIDSHDLSTNTKPNKRGSNKNKNS